MCLKYLDICLENSKFMRFRIYFHRSNTASSHSPENKPGNIRRLKIRKFSTLARARNVWMVLLNEQYRSYTSPFPS
jgi:hypothetical protein